MGHTTVLHLQDCGMFHEDAAAVMKSCPGLKALALCGNSLSRHSPLTDVETESGDDDSHDEDGTEVSWPEMLHLREADFRACELSSEDVDHLKRSLPTDIHLQMTLLSCTTDGISVFPTGSNSHIIFESSDEDG